MHNKLLSKVVSNRWKKMKERVKGTRWSDDDPTSERRRSNYVGLDIMTLEEWKDFVRESHDELFDIYIDWADSGFTTRYAVSIDRIDSSKGYTRDNVRWLPMWRNAQFGNKNKKKQ